MNVSMYRKGLTNPNFHKEYVSSKVGMFMAERFIWGQNLLSKRIMVGVMKKGYSLKCIDSDDFHRRVS